MIRILFVSLLMSLTNLSFAQRYLDLKLIDELTNDSTSEYFYPKLVAEFHNSPATIDPLKANYLYYGKLYKSDYKMFQGSAEERKFNELIANGRFSKAIILGENLTAHDPVNLDVIARLNICYQKQNLKGKVDTGLIRQNIILSAILSSGNGKESGNALKVVSIADEYIVMALLGVKGLSRQSIINEGNTIDSWKVKEIKSGKTTFLHFAWLVNTELGTKNLKFRFSD